MRTKARSFGAQTVTSRPAVSSVSTRSAADTAANSTSKSEPVVSKPLPLDATIPAMVGRVPSPWRVAPAGAENTPAMTATAATAATSPAVNRCLITEVLLDSVVISTNP